MADDRVQPKRLSKTQQIYYTTDIERHVITSSCERRGWARANTESDDAPDWNLYWASVHTVRMLFNPETGKRLGDHQMINHYPNHYELTRKDLMVKNIKRYKKDLEKQLLYKKPDSELIGMMDPKLCDFIPTTFTLPQDYSLFVEEFRRNPNHAWIMKPTGKAQGKGIFLV